MDHILYHIFRIALSMSLKNMKHWLIFFRKKIDVNKIENKIIFKIKATYYLELLMPEMIKLLGSAKNKMNKDQND